MILLPVLDVTEYTCRKTARRVADATRNSYRARYGRKQYRVVVLRVRREDKPMFVYRVVAQANDLDVLARMTAMRAKIAASRTAALAKAEEREL